jgi:putative transposase
MANADMVGAINGLAHGQHLLACKVDGSNQGGRKTKAKPASVKQEPTEATVHEPVHA